MDTQLIIDSLSRIAHVGTAIVMAGGTAFTLWVLLPSLGALGESEKEQLGVGINQRWKRIVHIGILLLLVTGFYNYFQQIPKHKGDGLYHGLLGVKMLAAFAVFFLASVLVGRSAAFDGMRRNKSKWLGIIVLLVAVIVAISGFLKVRGPKVPSIESVTVSQQSP